jgi:hypothetical protein
MVFFPEDLRLCALQASAEREVIAAVLACLDAAPERLPGEVLVPAAVLRGILQERAAFSNRRTHPPSPPPDYDAETVARVFAEEGE